MKAQLVLDFLCVGRPYLDGTNVFSRCGYEMTEGEGASKDGGGLVRFMKTYAR